MLAIHLYTTCMWMYTHIFIYIKMFYIYKNVCVCVYTYTCLRMLQTEGQLHRDESEVESVSFRLDFRSR